MLFKPRVRLTVLTVAGEAPAGGIVEPDLSDARMVHLWDMARAGLDTDSTSISVQWPGSAGSTAASGRPCSRWWAKCRQGAS